MPLNRRDHSSKQQAQALVELALVLTTLCGLFVAAFDCGRVMNLYLVTVAGAGEAGRVAAVAGTAQTAITSAAANAAADSIAAGDLNVTCQSASFTPSTAPFVGSGRCAAAQTADTAFIVTVRTIRPRSIPFSL